MVKISRLPIEYVGVGIGPLEVRNQVGVIVARAGGVVRTSLDSVNRVLLGVRVQVPHDQEVRVAAASRVGRQPVHRNAVTSRTVRFSNSQKIVSVGFPYPHETRAVSLLAPDSQSTRFCRDRG